MGFKVNDYDAVSDWLLTAVELQCGDKVTVEYTPGATWQRDHSVRVTSRSFVTNEVDHSASGSVPGGPEEMCAPDLTRFLNPSLPSRIVSPTGTVELSYISAGADEIPAEGQRELLTSLTLRNSAGTPVRHVRLAYGTHNLGRPLLTSVVISGGDSATVVDSRSFTYYDYTAEDGASATDFTQANANEDFFGYFNGRKKTGRGASAVLTDDLLPSLNRAPGPLAAIRSGSLKSVTDATGCRTEIEYEVRECPFNSGDGDDIPETGPATIFDNDFPWHDCHDPDGNDRRPPLVEVPDSDYYEVRSVVIGLNVRKITSSDPVTGRQLTREFSYSLPTLTVPLEGMSARDFISLSGTRGLVIGNNLPVGYRYTTTSTLLSGTQRPGFAPENTKILYSCVSEKTYGTALDTLYTVNRYMTAHCVATAEGAGTPPLTGGNGSDMPIYGSLTPTISPAAGGAGRYNYNPVSGYFMERSSVSPLLTSTSVMERVAGEWTTRELRSTGYSLHSTQEVRTGIFIQSMVYKDAPNLVPFEGATRPEHFNRFVYRVRVDKWRADSVITLRRYPSGAVRREVTVMKYDGADSGLSADSVIYDRTSPHPTTITRSCGGERISHHILRARDIKGAFWESVRNAGFKNATVTERWVTAGVDPLTRHTTYILNNSNLLTSSELVYYHEDTPVATRRFTRYGQRGLPMAWTENGISHAATWSRYDMTSLTQGTLRQRFTYIPLVGCTSVTSPSGNKISYAYDNAGRLSTITDRNGTVLERFDYSLYAVTGRNSVSEDVLTAGSNGRSRTDRNFDGFGTLWLTSGSLPGGGTLLSAVSTDAIGRPVRTYLPFAGDGNMTPEQVESAAISALGDTMPWQDTEYECWSAAADRVVCLTTPTAAFADRPATAERLCNDTSGSELTCLDFRNTGGLLSNHGKIAAGLLDVVRTTDPDGHRRLTFTDWKGLPVMERRVLGEGNYIDTYYIRDCWGRLITAVMPEGVAPVSENRPGTFASPDRTDQINSQRANYTYDRAGRRASRSIPGGGTTDYRYDRHGRLVKVTDAAEVIYARSMDFHDGADNDEEYDYDEDGRLTRDDNRGIKQISWGQTGNLSAIDFSNGDQLAYAYDAGGIKHRVRLQRPAGKYTGTLIPRDSRIFHPGFGGSGGSYQPTDSVALVSPGWSGGAGGSHFTPGTFPAYTMPADTVIAERVYIGSYEFEDSVLSRIKTPTGYWDADGTYHLTVRDFQGNVTAVVRLDGATATAVQTNSYYPYGLPVSTSTGAGANRYRFGGKELETADGVNLYDFEARAYSPAEGLFWSPDPLYGDADGAPHGISPRAYCAANPLRFIDPSGMMVIADERCQNLIRKGFSVAEGIYVEFNDDGVLNTGLLNQAYVLSNNLAALKKLSNSNINFNFHSASSFHTLGNGSIVEKELKADPNDGTTGVTSIPNAPEYPSLDNEVHIYISNKTPERTQVRTIAHEGYGHAYFYELLRLGHDVFPFHNWEKHSYIEKNAEDNLTDYIFVFYDANLQLFDQIRSAMRQAQTNYNSYWK